MKLKVPICPECKKELPDSIESAGTGKCPHCKKNVSTPKFVEIFSWHWSDRFFLFSVVLLFTTFFLPWFPGEFLIKDKPFSAFSMLINLYDLDVGFLASYNILRMVQIVPLFAIILFFLIYIGDNLKKSPYPGIFLFIFALFGTIPFFFSTVSLFKAWILTIVFLGVLFYYFKQGIKKGSIGRTSYYLLSAFFLMSLFFYFLNMYHQFYFNLETLKISETFGFWTAWIIVSFMIIVVFFENMRSTADFWLLLFMFLFSTIAFSTLIEP
ncbi:MAG: hypothetical protein PF690_10585, partial [Deltaproteobacteria bacterium]|nr:hypothetical protein [Deltaproteobacteria bacterium]